jgi:hypothetical protein
MKRQNTKVREADLDSLNSDDDQNHHLSPKVMELSKNQR